jgi:hypothetical protein
MYSTVVPSVAGSARACSASYRLHMVATRRPSRPAPSSEPPMLDAPHHFSCTDGALSMLRVTCVIPLPQHLNQGNPAPRNVHPCHYEQEQHSLCARFAGTTDHAADDHRTVHASRTTAVLSCAHALNTARQGTCSVSTGTIIRAAQTVMNRQLPFDNRHVQISSGLADTYPVQDSDRCRGRRRRRRLVQLKRVAFSLYHSFLRLLPAQLSPSTSRLPECCRIANRVACLQEAAPSHLHVHRSDPARTLQLRSSR